MTGVMGNISLALVLFQMFMITHLSMFPRRHKKNITGPVTKTKEKTPSKEEGVQKDEAAEREYPEEEK